MNGAFQLVKSGPMNFLNRVHLQSGVGDQYLDVPDVDDLILRLIAFRDGADPILDEFGAYLCEKAEAEKVRLSNGVPLVDPDQDRIDAAAKEFGISNLTAEMTVFKLCEALGIPRFYKDSVSQMNCAVPSLELRQDLLTHLRGDLEKFQDEVRTAVPA